MKQKILIIDDSEPIHQLVKLHLKYDAVELIGAQCGSEGIELCGSAAPDLILLDVNMPDMDGFEVGRRLKEDPATCHIPIIFLTSVSTVKQKVRGLSLGAADYVTKPFDGLELRARIHGSLRHKKKHDAIASRVMVDELTGLWNRAYLDNQLRVLMAEAKRRGQCVGCIAVDVDALGSINARFERSMGDEVLRVVGQRILKNCRPEDIASRRGGGTFAVLSSPTSGPQAVAFARRLWLSMQARPLVHDRATVNFKCSFGVAALPYESGDRLLEEAIEALGRAKQMGGGRVAMSAALAAQGLSSLEAA